MIITYPDKFLDDLFTHQEANEIKEVVNYNFGLIPNVPAWAQNPNKPTYVFSEIVSYLGYTPEDEAKKGAPNGYAPLNTYSKIPDTYLPSSFNSILKIWHVPSDAISDNINGGTVGTSVFNLPSDFNISKTNFGHDGGMFAQYTITFTMAPLAGTCDIYYYPL